MIDDRELEEDIALLVGSVAGKLAGADEKIPLMRTFQEVKNMLLERAERWPKQWEAKGLEKGLRLGKAQTLKSMVTQRFGELGADIVERIDRADIDTLDRWIRRLLDAKSLDDIFGGDVKPTSATPSRP